MTATALTGDALARRNVLLLAIASALAGANASVVFATGAIVGSMLAPDPAYATFPVSMFVVGMASGTLPNGWISRHYGRRAGMMTGTFMGMLIGFFAMLAVVYESFPLYCLATFFGGTYASVAQSYRFAAADTASDSFKPRAISWVMAGGVFAGVLGPQLVNMTMNMSVHLFAASYAAQIVVAIVAMFVVSRVDIPKPKLGAGHSGRPLGEIIAQPKFIAAALCGVTSYALMNLVMTSAPLAMRMCGHTLTDSNNAIQWHVLAMYGPSFFTGSLIARFGTSRVIAAGLILLAGAAIVDMAGITVWHFWIGLILLGIGWNFGFVGASALVTQCHRPDERNKVQAFNDFLIFGTMAIGSFSSGQMLANFGWNSVNMVVFPPVALALAMLIWLAIKTRKGPHAA